MKKAHFLLLLLLAPAVLAYCPAESREVNMAAVVSENQGGIFVLHVETRPGNGGVYTSINPRLGFSTQESEQEAVDYAFSQSSVPREGCDVFFSMRGDFGGNRIDGPSAGGAMSIAVKAALTNRAIRRDVVMTGTISQDGGVGEVGGIIEKALAAKGSGAKYILVPKMMFNEALLLSSVSSKGGFSAIEVTNFSEAERILYSPYSENFTYDFVPKSGAMPSSLASIPYDPDTARFSIVASHLVERLGSQVKLALLESRRSGTHANASEKYFSDELANYREQISMGYPFTAANAAFLLAVDAEYLSIGGKEVDINGSIEDVSSCLAALPVPVKTKENIHWAAGADLRRNWAQAKLNDTISARADREAYSTLRDLLLSYGWCGISRELASQAEDIGGTPINESALRGLSDKRLSEADSALTASSFPNSDAYDHLQKGLDAHGRGEYGAAIYEATYARSMQAASDEAGGKNFSSAADALANGTRSSLWGKIYFGQGLYLNTASKEKLASSSDAYRILSYSSALDAASSEIDGALAAPQSANAAPDLPASGIGASREISRPQQAVASLTLLFCVLMPAILVFYRVGKDGSIDW
ncbi:MAG: S16 family serine protease [Candidatus Micrarchaeia archaeon]|jgi:predicted S18 family serine protease